MNNNSSQNNTTASHRENSEKAAPPSNLRLFQRIFRRLLLSADFTRDDLVEGLADKDNAHTDSFDDDEKELLRNILVLRQRRVEDVMVRRAQIAAIDVKASPAEVQTAFETTSHSRLPVYRETLDSPLGVLHIKDVFKAFAISKKNFVLKDLIHPPLFVPPSMKVSDLLRKMQAQRLHMALVIDEHGGTNGLVSIEDLVEEIVGEIEDEHDKNYESACKYVQRRDGSFEVKGDMPITELESLIGKQITDNNKQNTHTVGSFVATFFGHVPEKGECLETNNGVVIEVRSADLRRVQQLRVYPQAKTKISKN